MCDRYLTVRARYRQPFARPTPRRSQLGDASWAEGAGQAPVQPKVTAGLMCSPDSPQALIVAITTAPGAITAAVRPIRPPPA